MGDKATLEDFLFVDDFDGHTFVGFYIASVVDFGEGSMAEKFADFEAAEQEGVVAAGLLGGSGAGGGFVGDGVGHC